jgi:hypothetical protein
MAETMELSPHDLGCRSDARLLSDALIVILFAAGEGAEQASLLARAWQPTVPRAAFVGIELDTAVRNTDVAALRRAIAAEAIARRTQPSQIILCGTGDAGRLAVDLLLQGAIPGAGVIGVDISLEPASGCFGATSAMVRLVQRTTIDDPNATRFRALIGALHEQKVDLRSMVLPDLSQGASRATMRAGGGFLAELVANASRIPSKPRNWL